MKPVVINETELSQDELASLQASGYDMVEQGSDEWFEERLGKATGSRAADIMKRVYRSANNPDGVPAAEYYRYMRELAVERLTGKRKRFGSGPMRWGVEHEEEAATLYGELTGADLVECGFVQKEGMEAGASPDRLIGEDGMLEIKCPNTDTHLYYIDQGPPEDYEWQMDWQMWVTGRKWCDFMSFDPEMPDNAQAFITRRYRDETKMAQIELGCSTFLEKVENMVQSLREYEVNKVPEQEVAK